MGMRETPTRHPGIKARHHEGCSLLAGGQRCTCGARSFIARVTITGTRRTISKTYPTVGQAREWKLRKEREQRARPIRPDMPVNDLADRYLEAMDLGTALTRSGRRPSAETIRDVEGALRIHIKPHIGTVPVREVRRSHMHQIVEAMTKADLSPSRIHSIVSAAGAMWRWAIDRDLADVSPTANLRLPAADQRRDLPPHTVADVDELIALAPLDDRAAWGLWAWCGLRRGELVHLDWKRDVDLDEGWVHVRQGKTGNAVRRVPLIPRAWDLLRERRDRTGARFTGGPVFPPLRVSASGLWTPDRATERATKAWKAENTRRHELAERAGGEPVPVVRATPHELRHLCATWLHRAGVSTVVRASWLGHSRRSLGVTDGIYTHVEDEDLRAAADALDRVLTRGLQSVAAHPAAQ